MTSPTANRWQFCNRKITDGHIEKEKEKEGKSKRSREKERKEKEKEEAKR